MSGSSSPSRTTPTTANGPTPLAVGTRFVKHYYNMLTTAPEKLTVYEPTSILSNGHGSQPAEPASFETMQESLGHRFRLEGFEDTPIRFEFENGAIDAQQSINGGILLVVTGHVVYLDDIPKRKAFVHTFFLLSMSQGTKRSYYVHNDILRFITDDEDKTVVVSNKSDEKKVTEPVSIPAVIEEPPKEIIEPVVVEEKKEATAPVPEEEKPAPGGGVEETKETVLDDEAKEEPKGAPAPEGPSTWASRLAKSVPSTPMSSAPTTPARKPNKPAPKPSPPPKPVVAPAQPKEAAPEKKNGEKKQRNPDCTLVFKNIKATTSSKEIMGLCEPFVTKTGAKVLDHFVSGNKGIAFVDFDSPAPVLAAVEAHGKTPFELKGQVLEVYQKTQEQKLRRKQKDGERKGGAGGRKGREKGGQKGRGGGGPKEASG